jgi:F420-non-reducing hydrogenase iron-sulfur subunit
MSVNVLVRKVLQEIGMNPERYNLQWASAAEAPRFVKLITDFTVKIRELGPLGQAEGIPPEEMRSRIAKALELVNSQKLRMTFGTTTKALRKDNDYSDAHLAEVIEAKLSKTITAGL